jgi:hypothetical protein
MNATSCRQLAVSIAAQRVPEADSAARTEPLASAAPTRLGERAANLPADAIAPL